MAVIMARENKVHIKDSWLAAMVLGVAGLWAVSGVAHAAENAAAPLRMPAGSASAPGGANHPALPQQEREGKVTVDPAAKFTHFRVGNKNVKSIYNDGKVVWVGTSGGVVRYDTRDDSFKLYDARNGLLSNGMFFVGKVKGQLAVGTYGGGLSLLDEKSGKWKNYNIPEGLGDAFVYDVITAKNGDIWIATWSGANRVRGGDLDNRSKWDIYTVENTKGGLPNDWVYGLAEGKNGDIWLATEGGMARFANNRWENWNHAKGLGAPYEKVKGDIAFKNDPGKQSVHHAKQKQEMGLQNVDAAYNPNYEVSLEVDRQGDIWAGTWGGGLSRFNGKRWVSYTTADGLPGNHVFMLHLDGKGQLWVGTNNGLTRWQDGKFTKAMTMADGLFANNIFAMATGADGSLWIGSFGGVAHLRPTKQ
jgi:ligand-binding sensor domain-containing protein